ncbi:hypothetical protein BC793_124109 [Actinoplanes xinjiangensis]|uniref:Uncharacterized protein n=1 Tax=Actinoplanes xinjiangensis TaxID=512350 RepID=A0A316EXG1_9ACTN|nr:hypothetical protein BC793_124109 [Actinoplanes xinjiangensis]
MFLRHRLTAARRMFTVAGAALLASAVGTVVPAREHGSAIERAGAAIHKGPTGLTAMTLP